MNIEIITESGPSLSQWRRLALVQTVIGLVGIGAMVGSAIRGCGNHAEAFPPPPALGPTPEVEPIGDTLAP